MECSELSAYGVCVKHIAVHGITEYGNVYR